MVLAAAALVRGPTEPKHVGWALDTAAATAGAGEDARKEWRRHVLTAPDRRETERRLDETFDALAWRAAA